MRQNLIKIPSTFCSICAGWMQYLVSVIGMVRISSISLQDPALRTQNDIRNTMSSGFHQDSALWDQELVKMMQRAMGK